MSDNAWDRYINSNEKYYLEKLEEQLAKSIPISELDKLIMETWKAFQFAKTAADKLMVASQHFKDLQDLIDKGGEKSVPVSELEKLIEECNENLLLSDKVAVCDQLIYGIQYLIDKGGEKDE